MLTGCADLREWLEGRGFRTSKEPLSSRGNECNWYACRRTEHEARECECNAGKRMQIVVRPFAYTHHGQQHESAEVELTGEAGGVWFTLKAYSLRHSELKERMQQVERMLVKAWNALPAIPAGGSHAPRRGSRVGHRTQV